MKRYPLLLILVVSILLVSIPGWCLNLGIIKTSDDDSSYSRFGIGVTSAIHEMKMRTSGILDKDDESAAGTVPAEAERSTAAASQAASEQTAAAASGTAAPGTDAQSTAAQSAEAPTEASSQASDNAAVSADAAADTVSPDFVQVDDSYFNDACFIGDSRTRGFGLYSGLKTTVYAATGYQIYKVFDQKIVDTVFGKMTVPEALNGGTKFGKVYLMFGLNEMGWGNDKMFADDYYKLIDMVKAEQPDAVIYVQSIIHVTDEKSQSSALYSNQAIDARNVLLQQIAENEHVYYLNLNEVFTDASGAMPAEYSLDGVHVVGSYMSIWKDYLESHAIVK